MQDFNASVPFALNIPAVHFESNVDFQKKNLTNDDSSLLHFQRKSWMKPSVDSRVNREVMTTFLASQGENTSDCVEKFMAEEISYRDLASLTHKDLELIGFKNYKQREELLSIFTQLPNQDPSYESICKTAAAKFYNNEIFNKASSHLEIMRTALSETNYKLKLVPPSDDIVGEKSFASRFVLEALNELDSVNNEIDNELIELEELVTGKQSTAKAKKKNNFNAINWILISSLLTGTLTVLWFWRFSR